MRKRIIFATIFCLCLTCIFATAPMLLRIQAYGAGMQNETVVYFDSSATFSYNPLFDAPSLGVAPGYLNITSIFNNQPYQVKGLPVLTQSVSIPLKVSTGLSGLYQIQLGDLQNLPEGACLWLYDAKTGTSANMRDSGYACLVSDTEHVTRFTLNIIISSLQAFTSSAQPLCKYDGSGKIFAQGLGSGPWNYYWKDEQNSIIKSTLASFAQDSLVGLNAGNYRVDINGSGTCSSYVNYFAIQGTHNSKASFTCDSIISENAPLLIVNNSTLSNSYWWEFGDGMGSAASSPSYMYASPGIYTLTLAAYGSDCPDTSFMSKTITVTGTTQQHELNLNETLFIGRDNMGWFVSVNSAEAVNVHIQASDISGQRRVFVDRDHVISERIYFDTQSFKQKVMLVSVSAGKTMIKKKLFVD